MPAPSQLLELVEHFRRNLDSYRSGNYKETELRREFVDPFFKMLGWDIDNSQHAIEDFKDVVHEFPVRTGGTVESVDYCFRIGRTPVFLVEAKKPSVNLKADVNAAYQARRYAWNMRLPVCVLTDFEEFVVYDCRIKPSLQDKASTARPMYVTFDEYATRWDEIAALFSREAVVKGSIPAFVEAAKTRRGTASVDEEFLREIEAWRDTLARNIALRNRRLTQRELNFAVQATLDRIVFLRMCEDRGIEPYGILSGAAENDAVHKHLLLLFEKADQRYNSGLFHFHPEKGRPEPDTLTPRLKIDDEPLREIIDGLYPPKSDYEFSLLPVEILGHVYEKFLGKVIRLTAGHTAKVEEKPEVKKAGGVYYTPSYIVDYIVKNTVGNLLEGKTPRQVAGLRALDPACGSGSFLIAAYQWLLDWHLEWYTRNGPEGWKNEVHCTKEGRWRLTTRERKRILLNGIFGVDIDPQAVEVTKLSLLLKVLEGESDESLAQQMRLFHERALPDLSNNIKCGNSLIGPDFYEHRQLDLFDEDARLKINAFDWKAEFPAIVKAGGFGAVIGNPPYVRQEALSDSKDYFEKHYEAFDGVADLYAYFMEKGVKLLRDGGLFGIIVSSSFLRASYGEPLRRTLKKHAAVLRIVDFGGLAVFANAKDTYVCIPILAKGALQGRVDVSKVDSLEIATLSERVESHHFTMPAERLSPEAWALKSDEESAVFAKVMKAGKPLGDYVERRLFYGIKTGLNEAFEVTSTQRASIIKASAASRPLIKRFLGGQDIRRYRIEDDERYLLALPCGWTRQQMPQTPGRTQPINDREGWSWLHRKHAGIARHLEPFTDALKARQDQGEFWWELRPCDYYGHLDAPKIIFPDICKGPRFFLDAEGIYLANTAYCLGTNDRYLLGVLNSRLFWFAIGNISIPFGIRAGQYRYRLIYQYMEKVPIRVIDPSNSGDTCRRDKIVELVEQMLALHQGPAARKSPHEQTALQRQIEATDREIDRLVYELYGLAEEEVAIVEGETAR